MASSEMSDEAILAQMASIQADVESKQPIVGASRAALDGLLDEYAKLPAFVAKIRAARDKYSAMRRVRGDGNCFYRAYVLGCLEWYAEAEDGPERDALMAAAKASVRPLLDMGIADYVLEPFWETLTDELEWIDAERAEGRAPGADAVAARYAGPGVADAIVAYARQVVGGHVKRNAEMFAHFLPPGQTVQQWVAAEVEPMGKEAEQLQCVALANEFGLGVRIEYVDRGAAPLNHHDMPDGKQPRVFLLYRPGHYDLIYPREP